MVQGELSERLLKGIDRRGPGEALDLDGDPELPLLGSDEPLRAEICVDILLPPAETKLKETETADGDKKPFIEGDATLLLAWNKDGTLDVSGKIPTASTHGVMQFQPGDVDSDDYPGHHLLVFP